MGHVQFLWIENKGGATWANGGGENSNSKLELEEQFIGIIRPTIAEIQTAGEMRSNTSSLVDGVLSDCAIY